MFERLTDRGRKVMAFANQEALRLQHEHVAPEHVLLGLLKEGEGVAAHVLSGLSIDLRKVRLEVEKLIKSGPAMVDMCRLPHTPSTTKVIRYAIDVAKEMNHNYVGTEHVLLGMLKAHDSVPAIVLDQFGVKYENARAQVEVFLARRDSEVSGTKDESAMRLTIIDGERFTAKDVTIFGVSAMVRYRNVETGKEVANSSEVRIISYHATKAEAVIAAHAVCHNGTDGDIEEMRAFKLDDGRYFIDLRGECVSVTPTSQILTVGRALRKQTLAKLTLAERVALFGEKGLTILGSDIDDE